MLGANILEFLSAFLSTILLTYVLTVLINNEFSYFFIYVIGGGIAATFAIILSSIHPSMDMNKIIIGAIMVMVPGLAMTNAIRDSIAGDLISGIARAGETFIIAISIAFGVGFILNIWFILSRGA